MDPLRRATCALALPVLVLFSFAACSATPADDGAGESDESALDYRSNVGREYDVVGEAALALSEADAALTGAERDAKIKELVGKKVDAITKKLDAKLLELWPEDRRGKEENIIVMIRQSTTGSDAVAVDASTVKFTYRVQAAGPNDLLDTLPLERDGAKRVLKLALGEGDAAETITLSWKIADQVPDAYPAYKEMFEDGLDIYVHVGGDHYKPRNDLREAEALYDEFVRLGLKPPVDSFANLKLDSGAFVGAIDVGGKAVPVRATLVHADMAPDDKLQLLVDAYKKGAKEADIVVYRGHAGTSLDYNGVVVHYEPRVAIAASEFKNLDLPDKYQMFVFDGCETYAGYADKLFEHPKKTTANADVVTSVNFGSALVRAESTRALIRGVVEQKLVGGKKTWIPRTWDALIKGINDVKQGSWTPIYGVHGLSDNPKLSPLGDATKVGRACTTSAECGGADSLCVRTSAGARVCGAACADDAGCPEGSKCRRVTSQVLGTLNQCLPAQ
jgi:hypothetical protein